MQNQTGNCPKRWDKTGKVVEKLPHRQYRVKLDGSGHVTLRNRKFLRKILPACSDTQHTKPPCEITIPGKVGAPLEEPATSELIHNDEINKPAAQHPSPDIAMGNDSDLIDNVEVPRDCPDANQNPRRGSRNRVPRTLVIAQHKGKTHTETRASDLQDNQRKSC